MAATRSTVCGICAEALCGDPHRRLSCRRPSCGYHWYHSACLDAFLRRVVSRSKGGRGRSKDLKVGYPCPFPGCTGVIEGSTSDVAIGKTRQPNTFEVKTAQKACVKAGADKFKKAGADNVKKAGVDNVKKAGVDSAVPLSELSGGEVEVIACDPSSVRWYVDEFMLPGDNNKPLSRPRRKIVLFDNVTEELHGTWIESVDDDASIANYVSFSRSTKWSVSGPGLRRVLCSGRLTGVMPVLPPSLVMDLQSAAASWMK